MFRGYCFPIRNGWHTPPISLDTPLEVFNYVNLQKQIFQEVRITDEEDYTVVQALDGLVVFPPEWAKHDKRLNESGCINAKGPSA